MATGWQLLGLILAVELIFAVGLAFLTRYLAENAPEGQTLWLVIAGVAGTVTIAGPSIGWEIVGVLAACFSVAGIPMAIEYLGRVARAEQEARKITEAGIDSGHTSANRKT